MWKVFKKQYKKIKKKKWCELGGIQVQVHTLIFIYHPPPNPLSRGGPFSPGIFFFSSFFIFIFHFFSFSLLPREGGPSNHLQRFREYICYLCMYVFMYLYIYIYRVCTIHIHKCRKHRKRIKLFFFFFFLKKNIYIYIRFVAWAFLLSKMSFTPKFFFLFFFFFSIQREIFYY